MIIVFCIDIYHAIISVTKVRSCNGQFVIVDGYYIFNLHNISSERFFHLRTFSCDQTECNSLFCSHFFFFQVIKLHQYKCIRIHWWLAFHNVSRVVIYKKNNLHNTRLGGNINSLSYRIRNCTSFFHLSFYSISVW